MLSQTGGTIGQPEALGGHADPKHYRLSEPAGAFTAYNLAIFEPATGDPVLFAFTSADDSSASSLCVPRRWGSPWNGEGLLLAPGQTLPPRTPKHPGGEG